jgi:hypothetical protein
MHGFEPTLFRAFIINVEISTNQLTPYLLEDRDSSYYQVPCRVTSHHERNSSSRLARYASNALRPSNVPMSKVGLRMLPLSRSDPLLLEFSSFMLDMLEVVDSPAELPKCVATRIRQEPEALFKTVETKQSGFRNRTLQFYRDRWQSGVSSGYDEVLVL